MKMKKLILITLFTLFSISAYTQDQIITILGDTIECNITGVEAYSMNLSHIKFNDGRIKSVNHLSTTKVLNIDNVVSCIWDGRTFSQFQLKTIAENAKFSKVLKTNLNLPKIGFRRMKWGGAFVFIGGAALTTGMILSTKSGTSPQLISALMIGGSVNITLGGALVLSGAYKNSKL